VVSAPTGVQPTLQPAKDRPRRPPILGQMRFLVLPITAAALWASSLPGIHPGAMNDLGLVSVLPWQTWLAFALLTLGFIVCWRRADRMAWLLLVHVLLLIVMLYGLPAFITHEPIGPVVFRHTGITENLIRTRVVNTRIDAYFSWPGFFMGLATLVKLAGVPSALSFAIWATVAFNLLYLPPLLLLTRALTRDPRLTWGAIWVFYAANWINQDYLAPQAFTYLFYLTILALLLTYLRPRGADLSGGGQLVRRFRALLGVRDAEIPTPAVSRWTAPGIVALVVILYTVSVASHQLTPFAILFGVAALVATGQCSARGLPLLMAVILAAWFTFVAHSYISGHIAQLLGQFGNVSQAASANVTSRIGGSALHLIVIRERLLLTGGLWLLALLGGIRRFRGGYADHAAATLGLAPLLLFGVQAYGGEMLLRIYFFMLPFAAFFAAAAILPGRVSGTAAPARAPIAHRPGFLSLRAGLSSLRVGSGSLRVGLSAVAFGLIAAIVLGACMLARYGNERLDYFRPDELAATRFLYEHAQPGSTLAIERQYLPWKYQGYEQYQYLSVESMLGDKHPPSPAQALDRISQALRPTVGHPAGFVILTRSQRVYAEMFGGVLSQSYLDEFERLLRGSPKFRLVYSSPDAHIYVRLPG
jgi:hypothetical protein